MCSGNVEQAAAYPEVYPNIKPRACYIILHVYSNMLGRCGVRVLMEAVPMRDGHDKEGSKIKQ